MKMPDLEKKNRFANNAMHRYCPGSKDNTNVGVVA